MANDRKFIVKNGLSTPDISFESGANTLFAVYQSNGSLIVSSNTGGTLLNVAGDVQFTNAKVTGQANVGTNLQVNNTIFIGAASINSTFYTGTANNANFLAGAPVTSLNVNSAVYATNAQFAFVANNANLLDGLDSTYFTNATNISTGTLSADRLALSGVTAGTYGSNTSIPIITVDDKGRITFANTAAVDGITSFAYNAANSTFIITSGSGAVDFAAITDINTTGEVNANNASFNFIDINTGVGTPDHLEGRLYWDSALHQLAYKTDKSTVTVNPGFETLLRVYNNSGVAIADGDAVYVTGTDGSGLPTVALADASDEDKLQVIGLATMPIPNGEYGIITRFGRVTPANTAGLTVGQKIYLSYTTPGKYTAIAPTYPNYAVRLGNVLVANNTGTVLVNLQADVLTTLRVMDDLRVGGDLTVDGDFTVTGNVNTTSVTNLAVEDNFIYLNSGDTIALTNFTGSGLNDAIFHGTYEGSASETFYVKIDSTGATDTFAWSNDNFTTTIANNIPITSGFQPLARGISIEFQANTGHTLNDVWSGTAAPINIDFGFVGNYNDGVYKHAGLFRDASDGRFKVFDSYLPEPDANTNINTSDPSFTLATFQANTFVGDLQGNADSATNALNANNSAYAFGKTEGALNVNAAVYATNSQFAFVANNTVLAFGKTQGALNVNAAVYATNSQFAFTANSANYLAGTLPSNLNVNSAVYATNSQFAFIANNTVLAFGKTEGALNVNSAVYATNSQFALVANLANYATDAGTLGGTTGANLNVNSAVYATNSQFAFTANNANYLQGQTWASPGAIGTSTANSATFTSVTTTSITGNTFNVSTSGQLSGNVLTTTAASQTILSTYSVASYGASKLVIQATSSGNRHVTEMLLAANATHAVATEYGIVYTSAAPLATYDVDVSGGLVRILVTPASATSTTFRILQELFVA